MQLRGHHGVVLQEHCQAFMQHKGQHSALKPETGVVENPLQRMVGNCGPWSYTISVRFRGTQDWQHRC